MYNWSDEVKPKAPDDTSISKMCMHQFNRSQLYKPRGVETIFPSTMHKYLEKNCTHKSR